MRYFVISVAALLAACAEPSPKKETQSLNIRPSVKVEVDDASRIPDVTNSVIGDTYTIKKQTGCHCNGSSGNDCKSNVKYTAPYGYGILSYQLIKGDNKRASVSHSMTQPAYAKLEDNSSSSISAAFVEYAKNNADNEEALMLNVLAGTISTLRVVKANTHGEIQLNCKAKSKKLPDNDNGRVRYDLKINLLRQPAVEDFQGIILELVEATEEGSKARFKAATEVMKEIVKRQANLPKVEPVREE